jgi:DNA-binding beta-propeller fold protein YncE
VPATSSDLNNRTFAFPNGAGPELAAAFRLPQGQAFTLQFNDFGGTNVGPVTLDSASSVASGTVTLNSCTFRFDLSTFPAGLGPQSETQFTIDPCQYNRDNNTLQLATGSGESLVSTPALPLSTTSVALVLTTNGFTGSYSVVDLASQHVFKDLKLGGISSDAIARVFGGRVYVVNRLGADSIQVLDPQRGFITPPNGVLSVGNGTDPQDIVFVNTNKAYVSRLGSPRLLIINPATLQRTGEVDLSSLVQPNDSDGSPDPSSMLMLNGLVYVALRHIDSTQPQLPPVAPGEVAVIDATTDRLVTVIPLLGTNPASELQFSPALNRILVSSVGELAVLDGGIEAINPDTNTADSQFVISEMTMGGDITAFVPASRTKGFALVRDTNAAHALITFDPASGERLTQLLGPLDAVLPHLALNSRNEVYVAVADTQRGGSGLRIFDAVTDTESTTTPLNVGQLLPAFILFIE